MNIIFREAYWGSLIILAGILLILRNVLKVDIPVMGIIIPVVIISIGVAMLTGSKGSPLHIRGKDAVFSEGRYEANSEDAEYNVVFGKGVYDLRSIKPTDKDVHIELNTVFGGSEIFISAETPMIVTISSVFGGGKFPDGSSISFGERSYKTPAYREGEPCVRVKADVVFGGIDVRIRTDSTSF